MKIICLAVGKKHDPTIATAVDDYAARLQHYTSFNWQLLPPAQGKMVSSEARRVEGAVLLGRIQDDDYVVLLDEDGTELASAGLASMLEQLDMQSAKRIVFVIGGAYGVSAEVKARANFVWSLSKLTFPHQLVRLILAEQLYRASTIRRGEPYHHE